MMKEHQGMPVLMSDILDITTSDDKEPKQEIEIKIPITAKSRSEGIVILKTPNPDPNLLKWEWEEIPAEIKNDKVEFKISHFCRFAAVAQKSLEASPVTATNAVMNASQHNRLVNFLVAVKIPEVNEIQTNMTITCGTKRTINNVKGKYDKSYNCSSLGADLPLVQNGQRFRIVINGEITVESGENIELIFNDKQESSRELEISYTSSDISGTVDIYPVAHYQVPVVEAKCCCYNLCTKKMSVEPYEDKREEKLSTIAFKATLTNQDLGISQQSQPQERPMRTTLSNLPVETLRKHLSRTN
ncbi:uncharacterized protein LOC117344331 isoform X1 [Pecten maximus]|uniref:uncharacterized protein LOC117344331 isoform X1 n=1 Tax=Pecten maximus TaxID=6579 RepID=UPI0014585E79|nr:uncharacterized protein LOC117344331 isoform X1 [Pecten maximus]